MPGLSISRAIKGPNANAPTRGTKTGDAHWIPVDDVLEGWITWRLEERARAAARPRSRGADVAWRSVALFPNPTSRNPDRRWIANSLREEWNRAAREAGVEVRMYEGTKHSAATAWRTSGMSLEMIQRMLRHRDSRSTERYAKLSDQAPSPVWVPDALFLLEVNPETKANVEKFVDHFKKTTIESATAGTHQPVKREKIHSAAARVFPSLLSGTLGAFGEVEKQIKGLRGRIWNAWCNPVHSNYVDIMQMYGARGPRSKFQIRGIPREHVGPVTFTYIQEIRDEAALTLWAAAMKLGLGGLADEIGRAIVEADGE